ncbi:hypothetical protein, partial [Faecalibaculum rodentium]
ALFMRDKPLTELGSLSSFEKPEKKFCGFFSGASRIAGFGEGTPQQDFRRGKTADMRILAPW